MSTRSNKRAASPEPRGATPERHGRVAVVGRPNVGKSTLLNALLGTPLAPVSPRPQTTRETLLGVLHHGAAELEIIDTPGIHRPRTELGRVMNVAARDALRTADVTIAMVAIPESRPADRPLAPNPSDVELFVELDPARTVLVVNKIDMMRDKRRLLPLLQALAAAKPFASVVPMSAKKGDGAGMLLDEVAKLCPNGAWTHEADDLTDKPTRFFAAEYLREQILRATSAEVPHAVAVVIDRFVEPPGRLAVQIDATVLVERAGQKKIIIGARGEKMKEIATAARLRIEQMVERKVNLKVWVKVVPAWRESKRTLEELGLVVPGREGGTS